MCSFASSSVADTVAAVAAILTFILGGVSAWFAFRKWAKSMQINQSKAVYSMTHDLFEDEKVCQMLYEIDHKEFRTIIAERGDEITLDKIFFFFDHLRWMKNHGIIDMDNNILLYWENRIFKNETVKSYWESQNNLLGENLPYKNLKVLVNGRM